MLAADTNTAHFGPFFSHYSSVAAQVVHSVLPSSFNVGSMCMKIICTRLAGDLKTSVISSLVSISNPCSIQQPDYKLDDLGSIPGMGKAFSLGHCLQAG
jgi:hypothetical protein